MLRRKIYDTLINWKNTKKQECLLVKGARQVGKSFIIREFGKNNYQSYIEINFYEHPEYSKIFDGDLTPKEIYKKISIYFPEARFIEHDTLIFLDEIQHCPNARTAIKFLAIDDNYDVISSGSLLGLHYKDIVSIPVGYERQINLYSLDFEEFLWAYGYRDETIQSIKEYFDLKQKIPEEIFNRFNQILREFMVVGGMPAVVNTFFETNNFKIVYDEQLKILNEYEEDIKKYAKVTDRQKIMNCYYSLPRQLSKEYTKFQYKTIEPNGSLKKYENSIEWLLDAGLISKVSNVSLPILPLNAYELFDQFKIYSSDIGLTCAMYGFETENALLKDELVGPAKGGLYENLIFDFLNKKGYKLHYFKKDGNSQEIEFLIEQNCAVIPIEVKSKRGTTLSLNQFVKDYHPPYSYKISGENIGEKDNKITIPHFLALFL